MSRLASLVMGLIFILGGFAIRADEPRVWTDSTGKVKITAKFLSSDKTSVTLEMANGDQVQIKLARMSPADRKFIADLAKGGKSEDSDPFKPVETPGKDADPFKPVETPGKDVPTAAPAMTVPDYAAAVPVAVAPAQAEWKLAVGSGPEAKDLPAKILPLPPKTSDAEKVTGAAVNLSAGKLAVCYLTPNKDKPSWGTTRVVLADLAGGKRPVVASTIGAFDLIAVADAGDSVLMSRADQLPGQNDRLEFWKLVGGKVVPTLKWEPYGDRTGSERDLRWACLVDAKRAVTCNSFGKIIVWDLDPIKPKWEFFTSPSVTPGLSADKKWLAFATDREIGVFDMTKGEVVCTRPTPGGAGASPQMSFSPSGKKLGCLTTSRFMAFETETGTLAVDLPAPPVSEVGAVSWPSDEQIVISGKTLVQLSPGLVVWTYAGVEAWAKAGGQYWLVTSDGTKKAGAAVPTKLPHPAAVAGLKLVMADPDFFAIKPNMTLRIDVSGVEDESKREGVFQTLTDKATRAGFKVGEAGDATLVAATAKGKTEAYMVTEGRGLFGARPPFAGGPGGTPPAGQPQATEVQVQEYISRVALKVGEREYWQSSIGSLPSGRGPFGTTFRIKEGQSQADAIRETFEHPNYSLFTSVEVPRLVPRIPGLTSLGTARVSSVGVK